MNYQELSREIQTTVRTTVLFTFPDGSTLEVDIPHFMPKNEDEIQLGIENRYITEARARGFEIVNE